MNMSAFTADECSTFPEEREFAHWQLAIERNLGRQLNETERNGIAHDLWGDGCDVENASAEINHAAATR